MASGFRSRRRLPPPRGSFFRMLPNALTVLALCAGMNAIRFAVQSRWEAAVIAIVIAAILDTLDGRTARLLNAQSKFGAELDSLADIVSFGVTPAILLYLWALHSAGNIGWVATLAFSICAALRLARFNTALVSIGPRQPKAPYFVGVPTPAGAGVSLLPLVIDLQAGEPVLINHPYLVSLWVLATALLMVSRIPTLALTSIHVGQRFRLPLLAVIGIAAGAIVDTPWVAAIVVIALYLLSIPILYWRRDRLRARGGTPETAPVEGEPDLTLPPPGQ
jgi:CDP-diacylglycerol--serine O-phosphatidyltransferase